MTTRFIREGEVEVFSAKRWDHRNRADLIESTTPCHEAQGAFHIKPTPKVCQALSFRTPGIFREREAAKNPST